MLNIFICEDNPSQLTYIRDCVEKYIIAESLHMQIAYIGGSPDTLLTEVQKYRTCGLYFIDIALNHDMDGLTLADKIRAYDPRAYIVFITADAGGWLPMTMKMKLEVLDYIVKGDCTPARLAARICDCIKNANTKHSAKLAKKQADTFSLRLTHEDNATGLSKGSILNLPLGEILYFEACADKPHNIIAYTETGRHIFRRKLKELEKALDTRFFRCHRALIVNLDKISALDIKNKNLRFTNGAEIELSVKCLHTIERTQAT